MQPTLIDHTAVAISRPLMLLILASLLESCSSAQLTSTLAPSSSSAVETAESRAEGPDERSAPYPPCNPHFDGSGDIPDPANPPVTLANGLRLEEYKGEFIWPHPEDRGCLYMGRNRATDSVIDLSNSIRIIVSYITETREEVRVIRDGRTVFVMQVRPYVYSGLLEAWSYEDHWCIEAITIDADELLDSWYGAPKQTIYEQQERVRRYYDVICDGHSLKEAGSYEEVFSFQVLDNRPFHFYKREGSFGINFDGAESQLEYDSLTWFKPHPGSESFVYQFENMVVFYASRGEDQYQVVVGAYE